MSMIFFIEMAWKSAVIAGAALLLAMILRSRAASDRAAVLRLGMAMLLALPIISIALPALQLEALPAAEAARPPATFVATPNVAAAVPLTLDEASPWQNPGTMVLLAWLAGLLTVAVRLLAGLWTLRRWTRAASEVECPAWQAALDRACWSAELRTDVRLLVSDRVPAPLSWGMMRPVILIDRDTLLATGEADAILAHEVAHVARRDWPVLMLARLAAGLFWFNPLVWMLQREIVQQAEEAADCHAADVVEPARYAQTLLTLAQQSGGALPANSIAPSASALGRRVKAVLDARLRSRPSGSALAFGALVVCAAFAAPVAALELIPAAAKATPAIFQPRAAAVARPAMSAIESAPAAPAATATATATAAAAAAAAVHPHPETVVRIDGRRIGMSPEEQERMRREVERAVRVSTEAGMRAANIPVDPQWVAELAATAGRQAAEEAERSARVAMVSGAESMAHGAEGMEAGARRMREQAQRFRDRDYREREIARARARGEALTHEELIEAADEMEDGARSMMEGAEDMRREAREMRSHRLD